jgi:uncharacterized protein YndB with AHSA1/START domain
MADSPALSYRKSFAIPAKPAPVFDALTNPIHLKLWFAEHVEVEPQVEGAYRFWGRHTLWLGDPKLADQRITRLDFPRELAFHWTWNGSPTQACLRVAAAEGGSQVEVQHDLARAWDAQGGGLGEVWAARSADVVDAFWSLAVRNLSHYLFEAEPVLLPDFQQAAASGCVELELHVDASPEALFRQLTEPGSLDAWIAEKARVEARPDGEYSYGWKVGSEPLGPTRVLQIRPGESLVHDWLEPGEEASQVRWEIEEQPLGTRLRVLQAGLGERAPVAALRWAAALGAIRERVVPPE